MSNGTALVADPSPAISGALRKFLEGAGFEVRVVSSSEAALELVTQGWPGFVFTSASGSLDGETLCRKVKTARKDVQVTLVYPPDVDDPEPSAKAVGADAFLVGPLKRGTVISTARMLARLREQSDELEQLRRGGAGQGAKKKGSTHQDDLAFLKRLLLMEVKRSKRYRYPVSFLLLALDGPPKGDSSQERAEVLTLLLEATSRSLRDIDLAVPSGPDRVLVFLPHTGRDGAFVVAERLREKIARLHAERGLTASLGISAYDPSQDEEPISFGSLLEAATGGLRKAQKDGGNQAAAGERVKRGRGTPE